MRIIAVKNDVTNFRRTKNNKALPVEIPEGLYCFCPSETCDIIFNSNNPHNTY